MKTHVFLDVAPRRIVKVTDVSEKICLHFQAIAGPKLEAVLVLHSITTEEYILRSYVLLNSRSTHVSDCEQLKSVSFRVMCTSTTVGHALILYGL